MQVFVPRGYQAFWTFQFRGLPLSRRTFATFDEAAQAAADGGALAFTVLRVFEAGDGPPSG